MLRALERWSSRTTTGLAWLDGEGAVVWTNARWRALGGAARGAWSAGLGIAQAEADDCLGRARASGEAVALEREVAGRWVRLVLEAEPEGVMVTATDVTAERRERDGLRALEEQMELREQLRESEERFRSAFENAGIGKALVSPDGRFLAVNRSYCELIGYSEAELLARDFQGITHPDDLAADLELAGQLMRGERRSYRLEKRYIRKDGAVVWVMLTGSTVREADGRLKHFIAQVEDITARKQVEARLAASEARYRALVEAADDAIAAFDPDGRFLYANAAAAALLGHSPEALVGCSLTELLPPERAEQRMHDLQFALKEGRTHQIEREFEAANGRRVYQTKLIPVRDETGAWAKVISLGRDVTEQRRLEAERLALLERAQKAQRLDSLSVMAGGVAHDLNNLLAVVLGHADCARLDAPPNSDLADALDQIGDAARRAGELARQLLTVTGKALRRPTQVGLPALVRDAVAMLRPTMPRSCTIRLELAAAAVEGDPAQLRQVLLNLLLNATQAIERGGGTITIRTGVRAIGPGAPGGAADGLELAEGTYAFVAVRDDGCGMTSEVQARVFEPFFSTKGSGRGLGLAVVHGVARGHRGNVRIASEPGSGTEVEVLLPVAQVQQTEAAPVIETIRGQGLVLVIDDERAIRDSLRRALMRLGFEVLAFESGQDALRFFRSEPSSVVLVVLDLLMPGMDGLEVLRELRKVRPDVQVVISSGFSGPLTLRDISGADQVRFLPKPYGLDELQTVLHEVVGRSGEAAARAVMAG